MQPIRLGIVGLGSNTRQRHVPGFRACDDVELLAVCNRRRESTQQAAAEFGIPRQYDRWEDLVADADLDAVMIGTWPYLHGPITLASLEQGKHVLTEARMADDLPAARRMLDAAQRRSDLVTQIVPSPLGLRAGAYVQELLRSGYLGELREAVVTGVNNDFADPRAPRHWRQSAEFSGVNMLALGILHETLIRWTPDPTRVTAATRTYVSERSDGENGVEMLPVERPDSVHVLTELPRGARAIYHLNAAVHHGPGLRIDLYGSDGTLQYHLAPKDRLFGATKGDAELLELEPPHDQQGGWRVEADFVDAIRGGPRPRLTDFATGVRYMEFTAAVDLSAREGRSVDLPLRSEHSGSTR